MKTIHKYEWNESRAWSPEMPEGAEIIYIDNQFEKACIWAVVDTTKPMVRRYFEVVGTGHQVIYKKHIGSVMFQGGKYVFHFFENV